MRTVSLITTIVSSAVALSACSTSPLADFRFGNTPARSMAMDPCIPGKGVPGQCLPYAMALQKKLAKAGIHAKVIAYRSENLSDPSKSMVGRGHAVVAYQDRGRTYLMDNIADRPLWVEGNANPEEELGQLEGMDARIVAAWDVLPETIFYSSNLKLHRSRAMR